ncbi:MAG TPA: NADH-quinone oxidoreductase subunit NuoK [Candidatus Paceibacterota bacterium]|nr:NADH-quinone oxidoreductase subunit NuoK [Verrucomicrobiota bacterium]HRY48755.1 NADH-quinone oxidoreductase subunit NuoK [Candidatus Paceibacterota bacterium]HRZ99998.1 NADH-quinone oxidoreductase subunit NuoK [Candidatus Paceibacterota bacterium]
MNPLTQCLLVSGALFGIGLAAILVRRNAIMALLGLELMLNAGSLNFIAFWRFRPDAEPMGGVVFVLFALAIAAAEAAVGLALIVAIYRHFHSTNLDEMDRLKG